MTDKPNIPFMPQKGKPPLHLREWTPEETAQAIRMLYAQEALRKFLENKKEKGEPIE